MFMPQKAAFCQPRGEKCGLGGTVRPRNWRRAGIRGCVTFTSGSSIAGRVIARPWLAVARKLVAYLWAVDRTRRPFVPRPRAEAA